MVWSYHHSWLDTVIRITPPKKFRASRLPRLILPDSTCLVWPLIKPALQTSHFCRFGSRSLLLFEWWFLWDCCQCGLDWGLKHLLQDTYYSSIHWSFAKCHWTCLTIWTFWTKPSNFTELKKTPPLRIDPCPVSTTTVEYGSNFSSRGFSSP